MKEIKDLSSKDVSKNNMTVGIGTIFNNGKSPGVLLVADKMISFGQISIEHSMSKINKVLDDKVKIFGVGSGDVSLTSDFFQRLDEIVKKEYSEKKTITVIRVAEIGSFVLSHMVSARVEKQILLPLGLNFNDLKEKKVPSELIQKITDDTEEIQKSLYNNIDVIIAGIDEFGAHLCKINSSDYSIADSVGFITTGSGSLSSMWTLLHRTYSSFSDLYTNLILTVQAKLQSEESFGVGTNTDIWLITKDKATELPKNLIEFIREKTGTITKAQNDELEKVTADLKKNFNKLKGA
jgi:glucosamine 6-phosphate synthetase-like amidotransferase/phosphosugar isomerase protein